MIKKITSYVFSTVVDQLINWGNKEINITCSMNITAEDLLDGELVNRAKKLIEKKKMHSSKIELELTERTIIFNNKELIDLLYKLREKGYKISIDDFGTGYNSLKSIGEISFDILKIDKYFIDEINRFEIKELVRRIIDCAHALNKIVIAEGVETEQQLMILKEINCDEVQGYYYSKPLLPDEFEKYFYKFNEFRLKDTK